MTIVALTHILQEDIGVGGVLGLLWFQRKYVCSIRIYVVTSSIYFYLPNMKKYRAKAL